DADASALADLLAPAAVLVCHSIAALGAALAVLDLVVPALRRLLALRRGDGRIARRRGERDHAEDQRFAGGLGHHATPHASLLAHANEPRLTSLFSRNGPAGVRKSCWKRAAPWQDAQPLLALASLEAAVRLVDDVGAAAAADHAAIPVARLQRLQAIANLHGRAPASFSYCCVVGLVQEPAAHLESGPAEVKARIPSGAPSCRHGFRPNRTWRES